MGGTDFGDAALIALLAEFLPDLEKERPVPIRRTPLHAPTAPNACRFIDGVFEIGVFNVLALDGVSRAAQILGCGVELDPFVLIIPAAEKAVPAGCVLVNALHGGASKDAGGLALAALNAFIRIDLPQEGGLPAFPFPGQPKERGQEPPAEQYSQKFTR
jgi:hypothetical protein